MTLLWHFSVAITIALTSFCYDALETVMVSRILFNAVFNCDLLTPYENFAFWLARSYAICGVECTEEHLVC